ncbi:hypothetical protein RvY_03350 [Ramazzottius varieornatus]|uniref:Uncharacterized protein n=1 Tax=Ramazzottius varieornatus TaxID=947166 RepID=A0A1D1UTH8_RAMVA|nr:hypothetical protein RvY_03350 [Ramazzottius varieornatus]
MGRQRWTAEARSPQLETRPNEEGDEDVTVGQRALSSSRKVETARWLLPNGWPSKFFVPVTQKPKVKCAALHHHSLPSLWLREAVKDEQQESGDLQSVTVCRLA